MCVCVYVRACVRAHPWSPGHCHFLVSSLLDSGVEAVDRLLLLLGPVLHLVGGNKQLSEGGKGKQNSHLPRAVFVGLCRRF